MLAHKNPYVGYRDFVLQGNDADTDKCYSAEKRVILIKPKGRPKAECGSAKGDVLLSSFGQSLAGADRFVFFVDECRQCVESNICYLEWSEYRGEQGGVG